MSTIVVDDGTRLHFRVDGARDGPPILFLNAIGTDLRLWDVQAAALGDQFRIIRYDARGHGRSDAPPGPYSIERLALDALAVLDAVDARRAHVCGISLGGMVALWLAIYAPERVGRAILANTAAWVGSLRIWDAALATMQASNAAGIDPSIVSTFLSNGFREREPKIAQAVREMLKSTACDGFLGSCAALRDTDLRYLASTVQASSLVIGSELDLVTPPALAEDLHAAIVPSELMVMPGVGHLSNLEWPDLFNRRLLDFLT